MAETNIGDNVYFPIQFSGNCPSRQKGDISTAMVIAAFIYSGKKVSVPFSDNCRYDLVVDDGGRLNRVQIKTARYLRGGRTTLVFHASSSIAHHFYKGKEGKKRFGYHGQVDQFAVYSHDLRRVFLIPIAKVQSTTSQHMRLVPPKNCQKKKILMAEEFEFFDFSKSLIVRP